LASCRKTTLLAAVAGGITGSSILTGWPLSSVIGLSIEVANGDKQEPSNQRFEPPAVRASPKPVA
jgi:hypothetical protein